MLRCRCRDEVLRVKVPFSFVLAGQEFSPDNIRLTNPITV